MLALIGAQILLYLAMGVIGFAIGWRMRAAQHGILVNGVERDIEQLRTRVEEAHVRRARDL